MQRILYPKKTDWFELTKRPAVAQQDLFTIVNQIFTEIKTAGDVAVNKYSRIFDKIELDSFAINSEVVEAAKENISNELQAAMNLAKSNIEKFHSAQKEKK